MKPMEHDRIAHSSNISRNNESMLHYSFRGSWLNLRYIRDFLLYVNNKLRLRGCFNSIINICMESDENINSMYKENISMVHK